LPSDSDPDGNGKCHRYRNTRKPDANCHRHGDSYCHGDGDCDTDNTYSDGDAAGTDESSEPLDAHAR
jgi:hypothetical protein